MWRTLLEIKVPQDTFLRRFFETVFVSTFESLFQDTFTVISRHFYCHLKTLIKTRFIYLYGKILYSISSHKNRVSGNKNRKTVIF